VLGHGEGRRALVGVDGDLHGAAAVAQVDEDDSAMVAAPVHPAAQLNVLAGVVGAQIAAPVAAHGGSSQADRRFSHGGRLPAAALAFAVAPLGA
jgi:hypothetical protein